MLWYQKFDGEKMRKSATNWGERHSLVTQKSKCFCVYCRPYTAIENENVFYRRLRFAVNGPFFGLLFSDYLLSFARCRHRFTP